MDELNGWSPPAEVKGCDLAVLPMGICEFDLFTGERLIHEEHPVLRFEATFEETLGIVAALDAGRVVLSHVEEMDCISYAELLQVEQRLQAEGREHQLRVGRPHDRGVTRVATMVAMPRSLITIDLGAIRHNVGVLRDRLERAELWAVVKADGYGHGAVDVGRTALAAGATALGVATLGEALELRRSLPAARIIVLGPAGSDDFAAARDARLELCLSAVTAPPDVSVHLKLDTGMGRWGLSELAAPGSGVVGLMSHFATADTDAEFTEVQLERFLAATAPYAHLTRHIANSAATLRHPASHLDAVRCGIAVYGISPFGTDPADDGLRPALRWESTRRRS